MKSSLKLLLSVIIVISFSAVSFSQISQKGVPSSFSLSEKLLNISDLHEISMPIVNVQELITEDLINDSKKDRPWRFGKNIDVNIDLINQGIKETLSNGNIIYRIAISSQGAKSINLTYSNFRIPDGAKLFIYNENKSQIIGAFTSFNNQEDKLFATTLVNGDKIILEYEEPVNVDFKGEIVISTVTHAYRGVSDFSKAFGGSGSCNVNVACPQSIPMHDQVNSAVMLVTGSSGFCSGALINNQNNDGTPYVLTADHCFKNPSTVIFWFNWQSATCNNPSSSPSYQSMTGATTKARWAASDMWLMQINNSIPASYNPFFAGWNRTSSLPTNEKVWGIHHPSGDIKKISWSSSGLSTTTYLQNSVPGNGTHWRVTKWDDGTTTEGGSSGSPLFDSNGNIIGQLHGGHASCSSNTSDWYGKLSVSWNGGGTSATSLVNWLAPLDTSSLVLSGKNPNVVLLDAQVLNINNLNSSYCNVPTYIPEILIKNNGITNLTSATVGYKINGGTAVTQNWTGNLAYGQSAVVSFPQINLNPGQNQTFEAFVSNPNNGIDMNLINNSIIQNFEVISEIILPYSEGFENVFIPSCWTQESVIGSVSWSKATGGNSNNPSTAYAGSFNALLYNASYTAASARLITPVLDLQSALWPYLSFWHVQRPWASDQDELRVYYRTSQSSPWVLLAEYTSAVNAWTQRIIQLPNFNSTYQIAFEGTTKYGYGVGIDNVEFYNSPTVVNDVFSSDSFIMYPNPTQDEVSFENNNSNEFYVEIFDVNGKLIFKSDYSKTKINVNLLSLGISKGLYVVHFVSESGKNVKKLIYK